jgi:SAM-dependent methyltransferase
MPIVWNGDIADLNGTRLRYVYQDYTGHKTTDQEVIVLKGPWHYDAYRRLFGALTVRRVLEFGIWEGGSALMLADLFPEAKIVGIDMRMPNEPLRAHIKRLEFDDRISLHYQTMQEDRPAVERILDREFDGPLDLVIDDCSHHYGPTRRSFEIAFPRLRPGGAYAIEDWDWAHQRLGGQEDWSSPVLSNLVFELTSAVQSARSMVTEARIILGLAVFYRGPGNETADLDHLVYTGARPWPKL